jgi:putative N6-adenine-specific DNA methylase
MDSPILTPAGLARRLKRRFLKTEHSFFANCTPGLERFLEAEIRSIFGAKITGTIPGGTAFSGPLELMYHANLRLRTAHRVLLRIDSFVARSYPELYNKCRKINWELYLGFAPCVSFDATAKKSRLHHEENVRKAVGDAVIRHMHELGVSVQPAEVAPIRIFIRFSDDTCTLSIDTSGELLNKRGYRQNTAKAPLRESIAAALLMACDWQRDPVIADPFCGAGTFAIEAAQMARSISAGSRRDFAFEHWPSFKSSVWQRIRSNALREELPECKQTIRAGDINAGAMKAARENAERAGVDASITFCQSDCRDFNADGSLSPRGLIIANPPYGKRIGAQDELMTLYREFGDRLRKSCIGWNFGLVIADERYQKALGLQASHRLAFSNGGIRVEFMMGKISADQR